VGGEPPEISPAGTFVLTLNAGDIVSVVNLSTSTSLDLAFITIRRVQTL
jgi:hypothetical protein